MSDMYQEVVTKMCLIHADDVEKCVEILQFLTKEDAKCGGRVNSATWRMLRSLIVYDRVFKSYSESLILPADKMPSRLTKPLGQPMNVVPVSSRGSTSMKRPRIDPELGPLPVDGDVISRIRQHAWFYSRGDNSKRSAIPLTKDLAVTYRHGENKNIVEGDSITLVSYQNQQVVVDTRVVLIDDGLDLIVLQTKSAQLCDRDLIMPPLEAERGMKYILMGYSIIHGKTSHLSFSAGIIASDMTSRVRFLGSSGSFEGDSGGSFWSKDGRLIGMQVEPGNISFTTVNNCRSESLASGGRCALLPITSIITKIMKFLPPEEDIEFNE